MEEIEVRKLKSVQPADMISAMRPPRALVKDVSTVYQVMVIFIAISINKLSILIVRKITYNCKIFF